MSSLLIGGIGLLVTNAGPEFGHGPLGEIAEGAVVVEGSRIAWVGRDAHAPPSDIRIEAAGRCVIPGFVDSHSHLVFAGDRAREFAARMSGEPYAAGGIRTTVAATRAASDEQLTATISRLTYEMHRQGTTTFEIKSGYGLNVSDERRSLALAQAFTTETTFLGAHVVPAEFEGRTDDYLDLVNGPMLEACRPYSRWIDVFCDHGAFDGDQARAVLRAGAAAGLGLRVHANQLGPGPGVQVACELGAASADHCTHLAAADVTALADAGVVATLLPGADFSTRAPYPDARRLLDAGVTVALATDCNPGTSYTSSMPFCIAIAVREMRMTPAEALWSATAGGARALRRTDVGVLRPGSRADVALLDTPDYVHLAYRPGVSQIAAIWVAGSPLNPLNPPLSVMM